MNSRTVGGLLVLVAAACFGTLAIFGKAAETAGINTTTLLTFRFVFGTALIWAGLGLWGRARLLPTRERRIATLLGVVYAGFSGLFFWGLTFVPAGVAGLTFYTYPVYVYLLSVTFLDERITLQTVAALALSLVGVGLVVGGDTTGIDALGVGLVLLAALGYAFYLTGNRAALSSIDADLLAGTAMVATTVSVLAFGLFSGRLTMPAGSDQWAILVGISTLGTAIPIFLYVSGLDRIQASHASVISTAEPLVTVTLGIVLLGESVSPGLAIGGALVVLGVVLVQLDATSATQ